MTAQKTPVSAGNNTSNPVRYFADTSVDGRNFTVKDQKLNSIIARCTCAQDAQTVAFSLNYTARRALSGDEHG